MFTLAIICIHLLQCIKSQWIDIWFEDGSKTTQSEWTESQWIYFDYDGGKYDDACVTDKCILLWGGEGTDQWIYRVTDVSIYDTLRLKYDLTAYSFEASDACLISYSYQDVDSKILAESIEPIDPSSSTAHHYTDRYCSFPSAAGQNTVYIWLETFDVTSTDNVDLCWWDNIYLQGILAPTASPTKNPTKAPTLPPTTNPSTHPTLPPTKKPTDDPTAAPTNSPTNSPTLHTLPPSTHPTPFTLSPTLYPTLSPTLDPTVSPTKNPTLSPTLRPTKSPTIPPTRNPSMPPTLKPTNFPTIPPTLKPTDFPTIPPTPEPTKSPTISPTPEPSKHPTLKPTSFPTKSPTDKPTKSPTAETLSPTVPPTTAPTMTFIDIWFEDGSEATESEWTESKYAYFDYDGQKYDDGCATGRCILLWQWQGADQWVYRVTDISVYDYIQLKYDVTAYSFEADDACLISYAYDSETAKTLAARIEPMDPYSSTTHRYTNRYCTFPSAAGKNTIWIWLETYDGTSADVQDLCFWDNIHLQGVFGPTLAPTKETANPTKSPTISTMSPTRKPTKHPTLKPTKKPTNRPTTKPTKSPTKRPTHKPSKHPTLKPTVFPTTAPTLYPSVHPTMYTANPTTFPTVSPTLKPSDFPTIQPTLNPSQPPVIPPTFAPTTSPTSPVPTTAPITANPSNVPSKIPSNFPTKTPTSKPTGFPTNKPTPEPSQDSQAPTLKPTDFPSISPTTSEPSYSTNVPTIAPTIEPTIEPTTIEPTIESIAEPTYKPTNKPTTARPLIDIYVYYDDAVTSYTSTETAVGNANSNAVKPAPVLDNLAIGLIVLCCSLCLIILITLAIASGHIWMQNKSNETMEHMKSMNSKSKEIRIGEKNDVVQIAQERVKKKEKKEVMNKEVELMAVIEDSSSESNDSLFDHVIQATRGVIGGESMQNAVRFMNNVLNQEEFEFEPGVKLGGETNHDVIAEGESYSSADNIIPADNATLGDLVINNTMY